ncbi:ABC transporter permease [Streptomyces sp. NPDC059909]|uniref:ABC transporter permease n=1 Tax=Streptomyces sp. NPDC059909 TaxID=3346998 RepID=UPI003654877B
MSAAPTAAPTRRMIAVIVLVPLVVALALWAFAWPAARLAPRDLPVGVAGPDAATAQLEQRFAQREGAFEVHRYADEASARDAIEDHVVYGAMVVTPQGPKVLTASAASPVVAQLLKESVAAGAPAGTEPQIEDIVPAPSGDPRGGGLASSILPLSLAGLAAGALVTLLGLRGARAVIALVGTAVLVGITAAAVAHSWLGILTGDWWAEAGVLGLTVLAVGAAVAGLATLIGQAGIGLGALVIVLIGNPFSGVSSAPELLPEPAGPIGQWLSAGASGSLLRSVAYFDGSGAGRPALVLSLWVVLGVAAVLIGGRRRVDGHRGADVRSEVEGHRDPEPAPAA